MLRLAADPDFVAVELDFDDRKAADAFAGALTEMWGVVRERFGWRELPEARIFELAARGEY